MRFRSLFAYALTGALHLQFGLAASTTVVESLGTSHSSTSVRVYAVSVNPTPSPNANGSAIYRPLFAAHSSDTPRFNNVSQINVNPLLVAAAALDPNLGNNSVVPARRSLSRRDTLPEGACAPGTPCVNGACCSKDGWCGYSPDFCGADSCISNCDAKASCGQYAAEGHGACPLSVCCSKDGFCGTTDEFCGTNCDNTFGGCGYPSSPSCNSAANSAGRRRIGYYEAWAPTRPCDQRAPEDLETTGLTHVNFAFAFFHPTTFQMTGMDAESVNLYTRFTALKSRQPGLQTWISIGGWSFNDETNVPNTRTAFSDMVSTAANRATFIRSLKQFMITYNFDGVDLDWEYPGADDRGGRPEDRANFVELVKEMKSSFQGRYGISATLPSSYWYLQHFDLPGMEPYLDWFNVMSYDIHGVWDSSNVYAGPYVRPHTNLTEIDQGLQLLWRVGVNPSKVVLGLGWYGRSFTLSDPSCNQPWCYFSAGGAPGQCSGESGILSNAEILREIEARNLSPVIDTQAAVAWVSWDDQWVSYDTAETTEMKTKYANSRCLGGTMIWAIDLDDSVGTSLGALDPNIKVLLSYTCPDPNGCNVGGSTLDSRSIYETAQGETTCYTSFCGRGCAAGYTEMSQMNGKIGYLSFDTTCPPGEYQSLCCADGTTFTTCQWRGYRGVGLPCSGGCGDSVFDNVKEVAQNTNQRQFSMADNRFYEETCTTGYMSFCCEDFLPPPYLPKDMNLLGQDTPLSTYDLSASDYEYGMLCPESSTLYLTAEGVLEPTTLYTRQSGHDVWGLCFASSSTAKKLKTTKGSAGPSKQKAKLGITPVKKKSNKKANTVGKKDVYGQWDTLRFTNGETDCDTTYTCYYGGYTDGKGKFRLFDQICDNQRYYLDKMSGGNNVFNMRFSGSSTRSQVEKWKYRHNDVYREDWQLYPGRSRCDIDEFPMNALVERDNDQTLRAVDSDENSAQGVDFQQWVSAVWEPCSSLRAANNKGPPPITWTWDGIKAGDNRLLATGIIRKYGFDSSSATLCLPTYTLNGVASGVLDHGFRVASTDPLFKTPLPDANGNYATWPKQEVQWSYAPEDLVSLSIRLPVNVLSTNLPFWKRETNTVHHLTTANPIGNGTETSGSLVRISGDIVYADNEGEGLCYKLEQISQDERGVWEAALGNMCPNAFTTDSIPAPTGLQSRQTLQGNPQVTSSSEADAHKSGFMTVTKFQPPEETSLGK